MTQNLKIEVVTESLSESGHIVTNLVTKEELSQVATKKADLGSDGKIPTSQLPENILNTSTIVGEVKTELESTIQDAVQEANAYAESYVDDIVSKKADLGTDGKISTTQLPKLDQYSEFKETTDSIKTELTKALKTRTDELEFSKASLDDNGKVLREQLPEFDQFPGVPELLDDLSTRTVQNIEHVIDQAVVEATVKSNAVAYEAATRAEAAAVSANIGNKVYSTPAEGVKAGTGVPVSSYFNVRSPRSEYYVDEYLNRNGVPEATGKSYPSAKGLQDALSITAQNVARTEAAATSAAIGGKVYVTAAAGVAPVTGVTDGAYFNVRSSSDESYVDEYQNVGGVATATGKRYLSSLGVEKQEKPASTIKDVSGKSQQEINDILSHNVRSIIYFENNIVDALTWVEESASNYLELFAETYELNAVGVQYLNRIFCRHGRAKIIISASTNPTYSRNISDNILSFENINFIVLGHRQGQSDTEFKRVFTTDLNAFPLKTATLKNLDVRALTDVNDDTSYVDNVGKTRGIIFIGYKVSVRSYIENINHYGLMRFADLAASGTNATHFESDVCGYNNETGFYHYVGSVWKHGESLRLKMINTLTEKSYWVGKDAGRLINGKNILINESDYSEKYTVDDIFAKHAIERSIYIMSDNAVINNVSDVGSDTAANMKTSLTLPRRGSIKATNIAANNVSGVQIIQTYGLKKSTIDGVKYSQDLKDGSRLISFTNLDELNVSNVEVSNLDQLFYNVDGVSSGKVNISNVSATNCYAKYSPYIFTIRSSAVEKVNRLSIDNLKVKIDSDVAPTEVFETPIFAEGVKRLKISNSEIDSSRGLFSYNSDLENAELSDVVINVRTSLALNSIFTQMLNDSLAPVSANTFKVEFNLRTTFVGNASVRANIKCSKKVNTGIVKCLNHWDEINLEIPVVSSETAGYYLFGLGVVSYFVDVEFAGSILRYVYDASTNIITEQVNAGGKLATGARQASKITLKVTQASNYRLDIDVGQTTWTGGGGTLKIKIYR